MVEQYLNSLEKNGYRSFNPNLKIFLISGKARHGKDTFARLLQNKIHEPSLIIRNADILKYIAKEYLHWNGDKDGNGRKLLQLLGTEVAKQALNKPFFWVEKTCDCIDLLQNVYNYFIVPDTRFLSEVYYTLGRYGCESVTTIRVSRNNFKNDLQENANIHKSETELDQYNFNYKIVSDNGIDDYLNWIDKNIKVLIGE